MNDSFRSKVDNLRHNFTYLTNIFSVTLWLAREQASHKKANFVGLYYPQFTTFRNETY